MFYKHDKGETLWVDSFFMLTWLDQFGKNSTA